MMLRPPTSDPLKGAVRLSGKMDAHCVTWPNLPTCDDDTHDARLADQTPIWSAMHESCHEPWLELIELFARIAQAREPEDDLFADLQLSAFRQSQEIDALGGDVLAQLARLDLEALSPELGEELAVDEMNLAQIGLRRVSGDARPVLDGDPAMGVTLDSESCDNRDDRLGDFGEGVIRT